MKFNDHRRDELSIDLTPLIDVVFMLLLFFVVSTTLFKGATKIGVSLPEANALALPQDTLKIEVGIDSQGRYYLDGNSIESSDPKRLKRILAAKWEKDQKASPTVVLVGDKAAPHQAVVSALEVAGELGIAQVQIVAQAKKEPLAQK